MIRDAATWVWGYSFRTFGTGSAGPIDARFKRRKKKHPIGFAPPKPRGRSK